MKVLVIGGNGLISRGIVKHLLARGADVSIYGRRRPTDLLREVTHIAGDRSHRARFQDAFAESRYDVVVDMIAFTPDDAESTVRTFAGRCEQLLFCSTVCTYGTETPPQVLIDETFSQAPVTDYGRNKLACEHVFERAQGGRAFNTTIVRPSHTYGPGGTLIDQLEMDGGTTWDRIAKGEPVLCTGDGLGLWQSTHRDDCGKLFAYAALNPKTYGEAYNATQDEVVTWRGYYRIVASALDARAKVIFVPAAWLLSGNDGRFGLLRDVTRFHGAYSSAKAKLHVPQFRATVSFQAGAREMVDDLRRRGAWAASADDVVYQRRVDEALRLGFPVEVA